MEEERTAQEIEQIFRYGNETVTIINDNKDKPENEPEEAWKALIEDRVNQLERVKALKKLDGVTSIWTTEDFTDIDAAITAGKARIA